MTFYTPWLQQKWLASGSCRSFKYFASRECSKASASLVGMWPFRTSMSCLMLAANLAQVAWLNCSASCLFSSSTSRCWRCSTAVTIGLQKRCWLRGTKRKASQGKSTSIGKRNKESICLQICKPCKLYHILFLLNNYPALCAWWNRQWWAALAALPYQVRVGTLRPGTQTWIVGACVVDMPANPAPGFLLGEYPSNW